MKLLIKTIQREQILDLTPQVKELVEKSANPNSKACLTYTPHTTCGILINENYDPDVQQDILEFLNKTIPKNNNYKHAEGNSDAHIKSSIIGPSKVIPISNKELQLGKWQGIALAEFDGPRERIVIVEVI